jgi:hypothetical protein
MLSNLNIKYGLHKPPGWGDVHLAAVACAEGSNKRVCSDVNVLSRCGFAAIPNVTKKKIL